MWERVSLVLMIWACMSLQLPAVHAQQRRSLGHTIPAAEAQEFVDSGEAYLGAYPADGAGLPIESGLPAYSDEGGATCRPGGCAGTDYGGCAGADCGGYCDYGFGPPCYEPCPPGIRWSAGVELTIVKPYFDQNLAFTTLESDDGTQENFTDTEFNYDTMVSPRIWIEALGVDGMGLRVLYWHFDESADTIIASPPANGFGRISHPPFGNVDLSTADPASTFTTNSDLNIYSIDFEATKSMQCGLWGVLFAGGVRYADVEQRYAAILQNDQGQQQGNIAFEHQVRGIGPTVYARTQRPFLPKLSFFASARGALVFGQGDRLLTAVEDADLDPSLTTTSRAHRDDLIPIGELQTGFQWLPGLLRRWNTYLHVAMESQFWGGVGSASDEEGDIGFFGLNVAMGADW